MRGYRLYNKKYHNTDLSEINFLITGGAGFIGSNLVEYLLSWGAGHVKVLDNFSTGKIENIKQFLQNKNFELIEGDIRNEKICDTACKSIDYIFHQAALGSVPRSIKDPITTNSVNISGFLNMLNAAKNNQIKRFIYAASSSTYGDSKKLPKVEDVIGNPLSPYAITKYVNELYAENFSRLYGIETIGLRYFNVFGQRQDPKGAYAAVIPKFISLLINHESPKINGNGSHSRDFTYIDNVIQMNILSLLTSNQKAINQIYNVGVGNQNSLLDLLKFLKKYLSAYDSKILKIKEKYGPERPGDVLHSLASISKAKDLLGYNPSHPLEKGIKESVDWYWNNL